MINYSVITTEIGKLYIAYTNDKIVFVDRSESKLDFEKIFFSRFHLTTKYVSELPENILSKVHNKSKLSTKDIDLSNSSKFQKQVLFEVLNIPEGETSSYSLIANKIGNSKATRAVAHAIAQNPIPYFIPCHRVIHKDISIGKYIWGTQIKRNLLISEGIII